MFPLGVADANNEGQGCLWPDPSSPPASIAPPAERRPARPAPDVQSGVPTNGDELRGPALLSDRPPVPGSTSRTLLPAAVTRTSPRIRSRFRIPRGGPSHRG